MEWDRGTTDGFVLDLVCELGTALLIDRMGIVWLYNRSCTISKPHEIFKDSQEVNFLPAGHQTAEKHKEIVLSNILADAR